MSRRCCCSVCIYLDTDFASGMPSQLTQDAGSWSVVSEKLATSDAAALIRSTDEVGNDYHCVEFIVTADTNGNSIDVRVGWDRTSGHYLFARLVFGTDCGTVLLGEYDGSSESTLQGPWDVQGLKIGLTGDEQISVSVRYNLDADDDDSGPWLGARITFTNGDTFDQQIDASNLLVSVTPGRYVGIKTGTAGSYTLDDLLIRNLGYLDDDVTYCDNRAHCGVAHTDDMDSCVWTRAGWATETATGLVCEGSGCSADLDNTFYTDENIPYLFAVRTTVESPSCEVRLQFWYENSSNYWYLKFYMDAFTALACDLIEVSGGGETTHITGMTNCFDPDLVNVAHLSLAHDRIRVGGNSSGAASLDNGIGMYQHIVDAPTGSWEIKAEADGVGAGERASIGIQWKCGELAILGGDDTVTVTVTGLAGAGCTTGNGTYILDVVDYIDPYTWEVYDPPSPFTKIKLTLDITGPYYDPPYHPTDQYCDYEYTFELEWTDGGAQTATFYKKVTTGPMVGRQVQCSLPTYCGTGDGNPFGPLFPDYELPSTSGSCTGGEATITP